jgi:hypothetical protein
MKPRQFLPYARFAAAQATYRSEFPSAGYARDLEALGRESDECLQPVPEHACLLDNDLATASLPRGRRGYIFRLQSIPDGFFVSARPVSRNQTGVRSFCSLEDGVVRMSQDEIGDRDQCRAAAPL